MVAVQIAPACCSDFLKPRWVKRKCVGCFFIGNHFKITNMCFFAHYVQPEIESGAFVRRTADSNICRAGATASSWQNCTANLGSGTTRYMPNNYWLVRFYLNCIVIFLIVVFGHIVGVQEQFAPTAHSAQCLAWKYFALVCYKFNSGGTFVGRHKIDVFIHSVCCAFLNVIIAQLPAHHNILGSGQFNRYKLVTNNVPACALSAFNFFCTISILEGFFVHPSGKQRVVFPLNYYFACRVNHGSCQVLGFVTFVWTFVAIHNIYLLCCLNVQRFSTFHFEFGGLVITRPLCNQTNLAQCYSYIAIFNSYYVNCIPSSRICSTLSFHPGRVPLVAVTNLFRRHDKICAYSICTLKSPNVAVAFFPALQIGCNRVVRNNVKTFILFLATLVCDIAIFNTSC